MGFDAPFNGTVKGVPVVYDVSAYDGVQFDIQPGSTGQAGAVYFEVLNQETRPAGNGGTANNGTQVDVNNNRGYILQGVGGTVVGTETALTSATQTVYVPFSMLVPKWFPEKSDCGSVTGDACFAPIFNPKHGLGLEYSVYPDFSSTGAYDLWVDNISFYSGDNGLTPPGETMPTFKSTGWTCTPPTFLGGTKSAAGKYLLWGYHTWKAQYLTAGPNAGELMVKSPEVDGGSVVSEGIAYGMILSAYFNDSTTFAGLWKYWSDHTATGSLMNWCYALPSGSSTGCNGNGGGSAVDADEDAAFALHLASTLSWGASYATNYTTMVGDIWTHDFDHTTSLPMYGSNAQQGSGLTNPSYFAPSFYRIFASVQPSFTGAVAAAYTALNASLANGPLPPAWCTNGCASAGGGGYTDSAKYQYDAHRVPWRIGIDYCWGDGGTTAQSYLAHISSTFNTDAAQGMAMLFDVYNLDGSVCTSGCTETAAPNSMSLVGSASVGALAGGSTYSTFVNQGWQFVLDGLNRGLPNLVTTKNSYYTYYNASVGLLTALTLSGNFYKP
jgi:endo-1,4-beta-D-glucanase Y